MGINKPSFVFSENFFGFVGAVGPLSPMVPLAFVFPVFCGGGEGRPQLGREILQKTLVFKFSLTEAHVFNIMILGGR